MATASPMIVATLKVQISESPSFFKNICNKNLLDFFIKTLADFAFVNPEQSEKTLECQQNYPYIKL